MIGSIKSVLGRILLSPYHRREWNRYLRFLVRTGNLGAFMDQVRPNDQLRFNDQVAETVRVVPICDTAPLESGLAFSDDLIRTWLWQT